MRNFLSVAVVSVLFAACAENASVPFEPEAGRTILISGNTNTTCTIDLISCFAILDAEIKALYEANNTAARRGEAEYRVVTDSNEDLSRIFQAETMTQAQALVLLDSFIDDIENALARGRYSECYGAFTLAYAEWIRAKVAAGSVDVSGRPTLTCLVSPVTGTGTGSATNGVTLTLNDPFHFQGDPYNTTTTTTYFVVVGPSGTITTSSVIQTGATTVTIRDAATTVPGTYTYVVQQCSGIGCSTGTTITVTIPQGTGVGGCVHDNRNGGYVAPPNQPKCPKTPKDHALSDKDKPPVTNPGK